MGYSHRWTRPTILERERFKLLVDDADLLHSNLPPDIVIRDGYGTDYGFPEFDPDWIWFNGDETANQACESFYLEQDGDGRDFCKTARQPYDMLVCATLIALIHHFPECKIESDGGPTDWASALHLYCKTFPDRTEAATRFVNSLA